MIEIKRLVSKNEKDTYSGSHVLHLGVWKAECNSTIKLKVYYSISYTMSDICPDCMDILSKKDQEEIKFQLIVKKLKS